MKKNLAKAIQNNNDLYEAIFGPPGVAHQKSDLIWYCLGKTPPLYSNLVTLSPKWTPDETFESINQAFVENEWDEWSIKDSFSVLDLDKHGFKILFTAKWLYLETSKFRPIKTERNLRYKIIDSEHELSEWRQEWDRDIQLGKQIFDTKLLDNPRVCFLAGLMETKIVSGCLINRTNEEVLGISNFFAPNRDIGHWSGLLDFAIDRIGARSIVGYEQIEIVELVQQLGFNPIGDLTIWLKSR